MAVRKKRAKKAAKRSSSQRARTNSAADDAELPELLGALVQTPEGEKRLEPTTDDRVSYILELMARDAWETGKTGPILAARWKKAKSTVEGYAARASSELRRLTEPDQAKLRAVAANTIARCGKKAEERGEYRTAIDAAHKGASLFCPTTQKLEHSGPDGAPLQSAVFLPLKDPEPDGTRPEDGGDD